MKFIFIGGTYRGYKLLDAILNNGLVPELIYVLKEDDHEENKYSTSIIELAAKNGLTGILTKKLQKADYDKISNLDLDFAIVCGWRTLIDTDLTPNIKFGYVGAHDSLLPKYRGFAPLNWTIINGEEKTGVTLFLIENQEVDSGRVIGQEEVDILPDDYAWDVYERITTATIDLYLRFLSDFPKGQVKLQNQNEDDASYTCKRTPGDGEINWHADSQTVYNLIRGLAHPYPGATCIYNSQKYIVRNATLGDYNNYNYVGKIIGRVIKIKDGSIEVLCGAGSIKILKWQNADTKEVISPADVVKSISATIN